MSAQTKPHNGEHPDLPRSLLVADDEHLVAALIASNLTELGYASIGPAADGEEAIALCREHRPDMAILDIKMPKTDGLDAAKVIYGECGVPVVLCSAYADSEYVDRGNDIGVFGYLLKPVTQDELRVNIAVAWRRYLDDQNNNGEIEHLRKRLEDRKTIEQAKWILVERKGISEPDAMRLLQKQARNNRRTLVDVSHGVIDSNDLLD